MNYANNAQCLNGVLHAGRQFETAPPRGPFTAELRGRLSRLEGLLIEAKGNLYELRSDKMGPWPEDPSDKGLQPVASGQFEDILQSIDLLIGCAERVASLAQVLRDSI